MALDVAAGMIWIDPKAPDDARERCLPRTEMAPGWWHPDAIRGVADRPEYGPEKVVWLHMEGAWTLWLYGVTANDVLKAIADARRR